MGMVKTLEEENGRPLCNYYGSLDDSIKPKYGVHYFVLDDYMLRTMDALTERAKHEFEKIQKSFEKSHAADKKDTKDAISKLSEEIKNLADLIKNLVKENELKMPKKMELKDLIGDKEKAKKK